MYCEPASFEWDDQAPFWVVWCPTGGTPTVRHADERVARKEAERLARTNPGQKFHVLEAKEMCCHQSVAWTKVDPDWIPF